MTPQKWTCNRSNHCVTSPHSPTNQDVFITLRQMKVETKECNDSDLVQMLGKLKQADFQSWCVAEVKKKKDKEWASLLKDKLNPNNTNNGWCQWQKVGCCAQYFPLEGAPTFVLDSVGPPSRRSLSTRPLDAAAKTPSRFTQVSVQLPSTVRIMCRHMIITTSPSHNMAHN